MPARLLVEPDGPVLGQAAEPVAEPDHLHPVGGHGRLAEAPDRRVQAGAVPARGEDPDAHRPGHAGRLLLREASEPLTRHRARQRDALTVHATGIACPWRALNRDVGADSAGEARVDADALVVPPT